MQPYYYIRDEIWEHLHDSGSIKDFLSKSWKWQAIKDKWLINFIRITALFIKISQENKKTSREVQTNIGKAGGDHVLSLEYSIFLFLKNK